MKPCTICSQKGNLTEDFGFIKLYKCKSCNTVFSGQNHHRVNTYDWGSETLEFSTYYDKQFKFKFGYYLNILNKLSVKPPGYLLDIGCGAGEFLLLAKKAGWRVMGFEPSPTLSGIGRKNHKLKIISREFNNNYLTASKYKLVTLLDMLEHSKNPSKLLADIRKILTKDGYIFISVPNINSLTSKFCIWTYKLTLGHIKTPVEMLTQAEYKYYHTLYFEKKSLVNLIKHYKFSILYEKTVPTLFNENFFNRKEFSTIPIAIKNIFKVLLKVNQVVEKMFQECDTIVLVAKKVDY